QQLAVRTESHAAHHIGTARQVRYTFPRLGIPQLDLIETDKWTRVRGPRSDQLAVRRKSDRRESNVVSLESALLLPRGGVPKNQRLIITRGHQLLAVGSPRQSGDGARMAAEGELLLATVAV